MSRYRSEANSLLARIGDLEDQLAELDRHEGVGVYASTSFARGMYWLGRKVGGAARAALRRLRGGYGGSDVEKLRVRALVLERALAERRARHGRG
jgi:hypothetical protein